MLLLIKCNFLAVLLRETLHRILHLYGLLVPKLPLLFNKHYTLGKWTQHWLSDWVKVLRPTWHKRGHFADVLPSQSLGFVWKKLNLTQQRHTFNNQKKCTTTKNKHKKLKPGSAASYDIPPGNGEGLFLLRRFINLSLAYLDTYPLTYSPGSHTGQIHLENVNECECSNWPKLI